MSTIGGDDGGGRLQSDYLNSADFARLRSVSIIPLPETRTMSAFVQPTAAFPPAQPDDPNSPVLFKDNISLVQTQITTVRSLAHEALNAMYVIAAPPTA
jgi:hypothetical protein